MNDQDGPWLAKEVYERLFSADADIFDPICVPLAVDTAARRLRERGAAASEWATFIHMGI